MPGSPGATPGADPRSGAARPGAAAARLAAALLAAPGTVTAFLEHASGEPVDADVVARGESGAPAGNAFGLPAGGRLVHRAVLLRGRATGRAFVYACSVLAADRLPAAVLRRLERSRAPIGRVLEDYGLAVGREDLDMPVGRPHDGGRLLASAGGAVLSRRYHLVVGGAVAADISEWYLGTVGTALSDGAA